ncbi:hypothetical protein P7C70_g8130, partial [Phenoliferia sp. Uapishka_3]
MKKGFFGNSSKQLKAPAPAAPPPSAPTNRPLGFHTTPVNSSTLSWSFLPPSATPSSKTGTTALLLTSHATSFVQKLAPTPLSSLPNPPIWAIQQVPNKGLGLVALLDIPAGTLLFKESPLVVYDDTRGPGEREREEVFRYALSHLKEEVQATVLDLANVFAGDEVLVGTMRTNAYPAVEFEGDGVS